MKNYPELGVIGSVKVYTDNDIVDGNSNGHGHDWKLKMFWRIYPLTYTLDGSKPLIPGSQTIVPFFIIYYFLLSKPRYVINTCFLKIWIAKVLDAWFLYRVVYSGDNSHKNFTS